MYSLTRLDVWTSSEFLNLLPYGHMKVVDGYCTLETMLFILPNLIVMDFKLKEWYSLKKVEDRILGLHYRAKHEIQIII